jgi:hypothetical protein
MPEKNVVELNDTDFNMDDVMQDEVVLDPVFPNIPQFQLPESLNSEAPIKPAFNVEDKIKTQIMNDKFASLIQSAKTPQQLKREQISSESPEARRLRLLILNRYKLSARFGQYLVSLGFKLDHHNLSSLTVQELDSLINDVRFCISTKNVNSFWQDACVHGVGVMERVISPIYNVTGMSEVLQRDEAYKDVCEELILEHQHYLYCKPEYRLMYTIVKNMTLIHSQHEYFKTEEGKKVIEQYKKQSTKEKHEKQCDPNIGPKEIPGIENRYQDIIEL